MSKVYLIGAGPGDEELITLKAIRILKKCTAILYDRLASPSILKYLSDNCDIYYCGKEPGCHYKTQDEINEMLVSLAKAGHTVGRIKGGDPYVFGRGGEEALSLLKENIEFETIPGITSPIAVLNYAGIPITHRGVSQGFHVFTGKSAESLNVNWEAVAKLKETLVFLMGLESLKSISEKLIDHGYDKSTPCAVVMKGSTSKQRSIIGRLEEIYIKVKEAGLKSPCIIVIGKVVELNNYLNWYENKPLFGLNICVTRSKEQAGALSEKLLELGAEVTEINSIKINNTCENLKSYTNNLPEYDYIVLTSVNGVNIFFDYLKNIEFDIRKLKARFAAIGSATERAIRNRGIVPEITCQEFVAEDLFKRLSKEVKPQDKILIPRSRNARGYLAEALREKGCRIDEVQSYEVIRGDMKNIGAFKNCNVVSFTSPSTVKNLVDMVGVELIKEKLCVAIGPITKKELDKFNIEAMVAEEYTTDGIIERLKLANASRKTYKLNNKKVVNDNV
jgi:uroporphyrinogen III methyltransferase/synthase